MPTGTPYNAFVQPYNIRVDDFASNLPPASTPALHLLTHTHSDHINGLSAKSFGYTVICSSDAKEMLLRHEVYKERALHDMELRSEKMKTFGHLKVDPMKLPDGGIYYTGSRDLLVREYILKCVHFLMVAQKPLPLNVPTKVDLNGNESVTITLIDANHCPGAVMYAISLY